MQRAVGAVTALVTRTRNNHRDYQSVATEGQGDTDDLHDGPIDHQQQTNPVRRNARRGLFMALFVLAVIFFGSWVAS